MSIPEPQPQPRSNARAFAVVTVVIAFIAGLLVGVVGDRFWMLRHRDRGGMRGSHTMTERIVAHFDRELHFTPQQRQQVMQILESRRQRINAISAGVRPQIRHEIDEANAEIEKLLTPEQQTKFREMRMRMLPRRDRELPPGSTPPRGSLRPTETGAGPGTGTVQAPAPSGPGSQHP